VVHLDPECLGNDLGAVRYLAGRIGYAAGLVGDAPPRLSPGARGEE
jgi:hypothetical protein